MAEKQSKRLSDLHQLTNTCISNSQVAQDWYSKYDVKKGLRDIDGAGVLTGLTTISEINAFRTIDGEKVPIEGELYYRGIKIEDLTRGFLNEARFGFEEVTYLLLFGQLPNAEELEQFSATLTQYRTLPRAFVRDVIMKAAGGDLMNSLARSVLTLSSYDKKADDISIENVMRQSVAMIACFPLITVYAFQAYNHYVKDKSLYIHRPSSKLGTAENILRLLRPDKKYSKLEARVLDLALVLHMEHGGGNNSTFTTRVVTSSGTDTYSAIAAALASLKGPKHGGANLKVVGMFDDMKQYVKNPNDEEAIRNYLQGITQKERFDRTGLIYGLGHAVYSISDPRAQIFKKFVEMLALEKGCEQDYILYTNTERIAKEVIEANHKMFKPIAANVDFYSGLVYRMLGLPEEMFTPIFAVARIVGWSAHRIEELINMDKIIRPAYESVAERKPYVPLLNR